MHAFSSSPTTHSDPARRLAEEDYDRLDRLLAKHVAQFSIEIIKLAAFCWAMVLMLAVVIITALR